MRNRNFAAYLVWFFLLCTLSGAILIIVQGFGDGFFSAPVSGSYDYRPSGTSRSLAELTAGRPDRTPFQAYLDSYLILLAPIAVVGMFIALGLILRAFRIANQWADSEVASGTRRFGAGFAGSFARGFTRASAGLGFRRFGLTGRMIITFAGIIGLFGLLTVGSLYYTLTGVLREHEINRAILLAINVSDRAAGDIMAKKTPALQELLEKHARAPGVAYLFIEDRQGKVLVHSFDHFPRELAAELHGDGTQQMRQRTTILGGAEVYEVRIPVLDGQIGAVHVGIWKPVVEREIEGKVMPLLLLVLSVIAGGMVVSVFLVWKINRPILRLVRIARRISKGELDTPSFDSAGAREICEFSESLERMRASITAALVRLSRNDSRRSLLSKNTSRDYSR
jgi:HAMP domain-containing protein